MPSFRPEADRFWEKVNKTDSCWLWTAGCFGRNQEYGCFYLTGGKKPVPAHRWAYENLVGPIPDNSVLDHVKERCGNTKCVNPAHLEPVSNKENILRGDSLIAQEARQTHCKHGHPLDDCHVSKDGRRHCRQCTIHRNSNRSTEYRRIHG